MDVLRTDKIVAERVVDLIHTDFPDIPSYIEPELLTRGGTLLLGGEAKCGKSFLMLELIRACSTGTKFMNCDMFPAVEPMRVLYIDAENGRKTNRNRLSRVMADEYEEVYKDNLWIVSKNFHLQLDTTRGYNNFVSLVKDYTPRVLVLDPISFLFHKDENSNTEIGNLFLILAKLKEIGAEHELSVVFSHHFGKPPWQKQAREQYDSLSEYNFRGASKWKDGGDTIITMNRFMTVYQPHQHWKLKMRFLTRHGSSPPECLATVNLKDDNRVRWERWTTQRELKKKNTPPDKAAIEHSKITLETKEGEERQTKFDLPMTI